MKKLMNQISSMCHETYLFGLETLSKIGYQK